MPVDADMPVEKIPPRATSDAMMAALYDDLHQMARRERWHAGRPDSWQTTAILHESYLKLYKRDDWRSREHFLGTVATTMRHILIDAARARLAGKRGGGEGCLPIEAAEHVAGNDIEDRDIIRLGEAMRDLAEMDPQLARLVDCRYFAGLSDSETAKLMGVTDRTIRRWWVQARAWIHSELETAA